MPPPPPAQPARSESEIPTPEPFCAVCDAHAWTEIERDSRSPVGFGTRLGCQMCGAHRIVATDATTDAGRLVWTDFPDPPRDGPGGPLSN